MTFTEGALAIRATIYLGNIPLDVYQMPDSSYKLYAESVTKVIDKPGRDLLNFLQGKSLQALPFNNYNLVHAERVEVEGQGGFIKPIPVKLATSYWLYRAIKGNVKAQALAQACMVESIERRADKAFSIKRSETEYNQRFGELWEEVVSENRCEVQARRLPGDDLYLPVGIN
jgi:hypothetical protein